MTNQETRERRLDEILHRQLGVQILAISCHQAGQARDANGAEKSQFSEVRG